jgi:hypothetical protein
MPQISRAAMGDADVTERAAMMAAMDVKEGILMNSSVWVTWLKVK